MKKNLLLLSALAVAAALCGCSGEAPKGQPASSAAEVPAVSVAENADEGIYIPTDSAKAVETEVTDDNIGDFIELGEYKGLTIEAGSDTPIEKDMYVNINYSGTVGGVPFDGGKVDNYELIIGSDSIVPGFEEQLIGHKAGDELDVTVTYPKDYGNDSLAGREVVYATKINAVYLTSPDIAYANFVDSCTLRQYPASLYDEWSGIYLDSYRDMLEMTDTDSTKEEVLSAVGMDPAMFDDLVVSNLKEVLIIRDVFQRENVRRDSDEYKAAEKAYLDRYAFASRDEAVSTGMTDDFLTYSIDVDVLKSILVKYEAK